MSTGRRWTQSNSKDPLAGAGARAEKPANCRNWPAVVRLPLHHLREPERAEMRRLIAGMVHGTNSTERNAYA